MFENFDQVHLYANFLCSILACVLLFLCEIVNKDLESFLMNFIQAIICTFDLVKSDAVSCWYLSIFKWIEKHKANQYFQYLIEAVLVSSQD